MPPPPIPPPHLSTKRFALPELPPEPEPEVPKEEEKEVFTPIPVKEGREERREEAEKLLEEAFGEPEPEPTVPVVVEKKEQLLEETFDKSLSVEELQASASQVEEKLGASALFDSKDIELKTDLSPREVVAASKILFIANRYQIGGLSDFIYDLLRLKVSQFRKGRGEFIQGLHAEERRQQGMDGGGFRPIDMLLGKLGGGGGGN